MQEDWIQMPKQLCIGCSKPPFALKLIEYEKEPTRIKCPAHGKLINSTTYSHLDLLMPIFTLGMIAHAG